MTARPAFIFRNFRLKLMAILVAVGMWVGVVYASNPPAVRSFDLPVQTYQLASHLEVVPGAPQATISIAGIKSAVRQKGVGKQLSAWVDLSQIKQPGHYELPLKVANADKNVVLWSWPTHVFLTVDRVVTRAVSVQLETVKPAAPGYTLDASRTTISPPTVRVRAPESLFKTMSAVAQLNLTGLRTSVTMPARVHLQGLTTSQMALVQLQNPLQVNVTVALSATNTSALLPVSVTLSGNGAPPSGYTITGWQISPYKVTVTGPPGTVNGMDSIATTPINIAHLTSNTTITTSLNPPSGVSVSPTVVRVQFFVAPVSAPTPTPTVSPSPTPTPSASPSATP